MLTVLCSYSKPLHACKLQMEVDLKQTPVPALIMRNLEPSGYVRMAQQKAVKGTMGAHCKPRKHRSESAVSWPPFCPNQVVHLLLCQTLLLRARSKKEY